MKKILTISLFLALIIATALTLCACVITPSTGGGSGLEDTATEGVLYELSEDKEYAKVIGYEGTETDIIISATYSGAFVTEIAEGAFKDAAEITSVMLPRRLELIANSAFAGCTALTEVSFEYLSTRPDITIEASAFEDCAALETIEIPDSVVAIGEGAFRGCVMLDQVNFVGNSGFNKWASISFADDFANPLYYADKFYINGSAITSVELSGVEHISKYVFGFSSLEELRLSDDVKSIAGGALYDCTGLSYLSLSFIGGGDSENAFLGYLFGAASYEQGGAFVPDSLKEITLTGEYDIPDRAFFGIDSIEKINFEGKCNSIGGEAFANCTGFSEFAVPKSTASIGAGAFAGCTSLTSIEIPFVGGSLTENRYIGYIFGAGSADATASNMPTSLTSITVTTAADIAGGAFAGAAAVESIALHKGCQRIGAGAFAGCSSLKGIYIPFVGETTSSNRTMEYVIGDSAVLASLETVSLTTTADIPASAFVGCTGLKTVSIPMGVTSIGERAFNGCSSLVFVTIPYTVTTVGANVFTGCSSTAYIFAMASSRPAGWSSSFNSQGGKVRWSQTYHGSTDDGFEFTQKLDQVTIAGYTGTKTVVNIPSSINGFTVVGIGEDAFKDNVDITRVVFPDTILTIGANAFYCCYNLTSLALPESLTMIDNCAFYGCGITEITIPKNVTTLGISAISYCPNLSKVIFANDSKLTTVKELAFRGSTALTSVYISDLSFWCNITFEDKDSNPLANAEKLYVGGSLVWGAVIPEGVTTIKTYAFMGKALRAIILPESVTTIENDAFNGCSGLSGIYLSSEISSIGSNAFLSCPRLTFYYEGTEIPTSWSADWNYANRPIVYSCLSSGVTSDGFAWIQTSADEAMIYSYIGYDYDITLPSSAGPLNVTAVAQSAFRDISSISSVYIPESITNISKDAFSGCTSLTRATFENTEGWRYANTESAAGTEFLADELSDAAIAAEYLRSKYSKNYWKK